MSGILPFLDSSPVAIVALACHAGFHFSVQTRVERIGDVSDRLRANWRILGMLGHRHGQDERPTIFQMSSSSGAGALRGRPGLGALEGLGQEAMGLVRFIEPIDYYSSTEMSCWHYDS
ncbi:uncharacterized protein N7496_001422 [Penicillium cataractarum]|uniref:Uncharacterized protein n=1 Tax=Penicillium cataractarum TaxID=2100454 RepID=A0A9W9VWB6_9EURO|nr:uncharacterized protein N7496_001422 [Penicillium cataractarum]KAJ5390354.1 hypothetical protein N7496_001422 [Penicillium cataractarum]